MSFGSKHFVFCRASSELSAFFCCSEVMCPLFHVNRSRRKEFSSFKVSSSDYFKSSCLSQIRGRDKHNVYSDRCQKVNNLIGQLCIKCFRIVLGCLVNNAACPK